MKSLYANNRGALFIYWIPALIISVLFSPVYGLVITSFILGGWHGYILLVVTKRNPFFYVGYAVIDFIVAWVLPVTVAQLDCWFSFSRLSLTACIDGYFDVFFIIISAIATGISMVLIYIMSFFD